MQYYIYENDQPKLVSEQEFENWQRPFDLPFYSKQVNDCTYTIEVIYQGAHDESEYNNPLPFIVFYFEDIPNLTDEGITIHHENDTIDYFATYDEMMSRYLELVTKIESNI